MNLCIDIGNSFYKFGTFDDDKLVSLIRGYNINQVDALKSLDLRQYNQIIFSASGDIHDDFLEILNAKNHLKIIELTSETNIPINIHYKSPETLGKDRIAGACGSMLFFPNHSRLIVDLGTCITYNILDNCNNFLGGAISPNIEMRIEAMSVFTANLPLVEKELPASFIGDDTISSLQNGAVRGTIFEIESFITKFLEKFTDLKVILTGGGLDFFENKINSKIFAIPNLQIFGLNEILRYNET